MIRKKIDIKKFIKLYQNNSLETLSKLFNVSLPVIRRNVKELKLKRTKKEQIELRKKTCIKKYGVTNPMKNSKIKKKVEKIMKKKYGVKHALQNKKIYKKMCKENLKKYGVKYVSQNNNIKKKIEDTNIKKYGTKNPMQNNKIREKQKNTILQRYGVENVSQSEKIKKKKYITNIKKFGTKEYMSSSDFREKSKKTVREKYGKEYIMQVQEVKDKIKQTNLRKYGKPYYTQTEEFKKQVKLTNQQKYGVEWTCQRPENLIRKSNSNKNKEIAKILNKYKIKYIQEYGIKNRAYDFYLKKYNILIEINPSITHSSNIKIFEKKPPLPPDYHFNKTKLANENGFKCICIWDWDDPEKIIKAIKNNTLKIVKTKKMVYYYNIKTKEILKKKTKDIRIEYYKNKRPNWAKIYNDGQKIVYN